MARLAGQAMTVFDVGNAHHIADIEDCELDFDTKTEDGSGVHDDWEFPVNVKRSGKISATTFIDNSGTIWQLPIWGTVVALTLTTGGVTYTGNWLCKMVKHGVKRDSLQKCTLEFHSQGAITIT